MVHAVYPGSFDPLHNGHLDVVERISKIYDQVTVAVLDNPLKNTKTFTIDERLAIIKASTKNLENVRAEKFEGLLVNYVRSKEAQIVVKGLRSVFDFDYELQMAHLNRHVSGDIDTSFMMTSAHWSYVSSTRVKELATYGADISELVPPATLKALKGKFSS